MTDPMIDNARQRAARLGPSMALRSAGPAGYETTSRQQAGPDPAMLERHEHLSRRTGAAGPADAGLAQRQLELRRLELASLTES